MELRSNTRDKAKHFQYFTIKSSPYISWVSMII